MTHMDTLHNTLHVHMPGGTADPSWGLGLHDEFRKTTWSQTNSEPAKTPLENGRYLSDRTSPHLCGVQFGDESDARYCACKSTPLLVNIILVSQVA